MAGKNGNGILALLAGAAIGVGLGILFAPEKGSKTREKIKDGFDDFKNDILSTLDTFKTEAEEKFSETEDKVKGNVEDFLSDSSYKAEEAIAFLEQKLAELKKQNAKLQK